VRSDGVPIVLASSSPRRRELLALLGLSFEVSPANIDESWRNGEPPAAHAERLAREKSEAGARPGVAVVGADTIVVVDGAILGKPADAAEARVMLRRLSGREHEVFTGVAVGYEGRMASGVERTTVRFRSLDDATIAAYVETGEPMDKAGAYGIQGVGAMLVRSISGSYTNVVGLPLSETVDLLTRAGVWRPFAGGEP
jgi:septum formation protein